MTGGSGRIILLADLDGTLIERSASVGQGCRRLIAELEKRQGLLVPASARPIDNIARLFATTPVVGPAIASGGGVIGVIDRGRVTDVLHEETLELSDGDRFLAALRAHAEAGDGVLFQFRDSSRDFAVAITGAPQLQRNELEMLLGTRRRESADQTASLAASRALGVSFLGRAARSSEPRALPDGLEGVVAHLPPHWRWTAYPEVRLPGRQWLEVFSDRAEKGSASDWIIARLSEGTESPKILAAGDAADDIALFKRAARSWCPATAREDVQAAADEVLQVPGGDAFADALARGVHDLSYEGPTPDAYRRGRDSNAR